MPWKKRVLVVRGFVRLASAGVMRWDHAGCKITNKDRKGDDLEKKKKEEVDLLNESSK